MKIFIGILIVVAIWALFMAPIWWIHCMKELFGIDWSGKYWTVFGFMFLVSSLFNARYSGK